MRCPHCGGEVLLALAAPPDGTGESRETLLPAGEPRPDAKAPAHPGGERPRRQVRGGDGFAPLCENCGTETVGRRRNGGWFRTCYRCG